MKQNSLRLVPLYKDDGCQREGECCHAGGLEYTWDSIDQDQVHAGRFVAKGKSGYVAQKQPSTRKHCVCKQQSRRCVAAVWILKLLYPLFGDLSSRPHEFLCGSLWLLNLPACWSHPRWKVTNDMYSCFSTWFTVTVLFWIQLNFFVFTFLLLANI